MIHGTCGNCGGPVMDMHGGSVREGVHMAPQPLAIKCNSCGAYPMYKYGPVIPMQEKKDK